MSVSYTIEASLRHHVMVQGYASGEAKKAGKRINQMMNRVAAMIEAPEAIGQIAISASAWAEMREAIDDELDSLSALTRKELVDFGLQESEFYTELLERATIAGTAVNTIGVKEINKVLKSPMRLEGSGALSIDQAIKKFSKNRTKEIKRVIQTGYLVGETNEEIAIKLKRLAKNRSIPQAKSLTITLVNYMSSQAGTETALNNSDIVEFERWISVLDDRTTIGCASLDGMEFPVDKGPPAPRHWRCRSTRVEVVKPEYRILGLDGKRSSVDGPVSAKVTYGGFLRRQNSQFRKTVLGRDRARLFDSGGLSIEKFSDDMGNQFTLRQLKNRNPLAFEKAGLID